MIVVTNDEMRRFDQYAIQDLGQPSLALMEMAGAAGARFLQEQFGDPKGRRIHVIAGSGNNGGDGLVTARYLINAGAKVRISMAADPQSLSPDCRHHVELLKKLQIEVDWLHERSLPKLRVGLRVADVIVDAMLGTGAQGPLRGLYAAAAELVNQAGVPVLALDLPSGVNGTSGAVDGKAVRAAATVTFGFVKQGMLLYPGAEHVGTWRVADIGIPLTAAKNVQRILMDRKQALGFLPQRPPWGHKGTFGRGLIIAGSRQMAGAAYLAGRAMLVSGSGLVTVAVPEAIAGWYAPGELLVEPIPDNGSGFFSSGSIPRLKELLADKDALVIGPGLSQAGHTTAVVKALLETWNGPTVLDADAINGLEHEEAWLQSIPRRKRAEWVFTPHPGEMARLTGLETDFINANRPGTAARLQQKLGSIIVLKGAPTVTAGSDRLYFNCGGNSGMGSAGTGDVLAGLCGGFMAQGVEALPAAAAAAYFHAAAGDLAAAEKGMRAMTAADLLEQLCCALPKD